MQKVVTQEYYLYFKNINCAIIEKKKKKYQEYFQKLELQYFCSSDMDSFDNINIIVIICNL